jgi:hypothetical protein
MLPGPLFLLALSGCTGPDDPTPDITIPDEDFIYVGPSRPRGAIFKGPMTTEGSVTLQRLDDDLSDAGAPLTLPVDDASGSWEADLPEAGPILVLASGTFFDESLAVVDGTPITLGAYANLDAEDVPVQVNLLTDLTRDRVRVLVDDGAPLADALENAQAELLDALDFGVVRPERLGTAVLPYADDTDAAWLVSASAVFATLAAELRDSGEGDLPGLLDDVRSDLADDGQLDPTLSERIAGSERDLEVGLVLEDLARYFETAELDVDLPDPNTVLDSDGDGIVNADDVCPFVADPDQTPGSNGFGAACDFRLSTLSTSSGYGCGLLLDGSLVCWHEEAGVYGGAPPVPDQPSSFQYGPWGEGVPSPFPRTYSDVVVSDNIVCVNEASDLVCWSDERPDTFFAAGPVQEIELSQDLACLIDGAGTLVCHDHAGTQLFSQAGPWREAASHGSSVMCVINASDRVQCFDAAGAEVTDDVQPPDQVAGLMSGTDADPPETLVSEVGGGVARYFDGGTFSIGTGRDMTRLSVSDGAICYADVEGLQVCVFDAKCGPLEITRPIEGFPGFFDTGRCTACYLDELGYGRCAPRAHIRLDL